MISMSCRRVFTDVTSVDPYICATIREVRDRVGTDEPDEEGEGNDIVSSDVGFVYWTLVCLMFGRSRTQHASYHLAVCSLFGADRIR